MTTFAINHHHHHIDELRYLRSRVLELEARLRGRIVIKPTKRKPNLYGLYPSEVRVLKLVAHCLSDRQIADELCLSPLTVGTHVSHIITKLGLENRTQVALYAWREGIVDIDEAWATVERKREAT